MNEIYEKDKNYYLKMLNSRTHKFWDYVVITAFDNKQAIYYRKQIKERIRSKSLPDQTKYIVVPDNKEHGSGSGLAILNVLLELQKICGNDLITKKILIINSGGFSKRVPQYSSTGKIFIPIETNFLNYLSSTIFDEIMISLAKISQIMTPGIVICCGDVVLRFEKDNIKFNNDPLVLFTMEVPVAKSQEFGVFKLDENNNLVNIFQKANEKTLIDNGAVTNGNVFLDTGILYINNEVIKSLLSLLFTYGKIDQKKVELFLNKNMNLHLYVDFVFPFIINSKFSDFSNQISESNISDKLLECRNEIWKKMKGYNAKLIKLKNPTYFHYGTTSEILKINYLYNDDTNNPHYINSIVKNSLIGSNCRIENAIINDSKLGDNILISNSTINNQQIPSNICLNTIKMDDGSFVTKIYGIDDNIKNNFHENLLLFDKSIKRSFEFYGVDISKIWSDNDLSLWNAKIYVKCSTVDESVEEALKLYRMLNLQLSHIEVKNWLLNRRISLASMHQEVDLGYDAEHIKNISNSIKMNLILFLLRKKFPTKYIIPILGNNENYIIEYLLSNINNIDIPKYRIYFILSEFLKNNNTDLCIYNNFQDLLYKNVYDIIASRCKEKNHKQIIFSEKNVKINMPLRLNFGAAWNDLAPLCFEEKGIVLNASITINNEFPISIEVKKIGDLNIEIHDISNNRHITFNKYDELFNYDNIFGLFKACLIVSGIIPSNKEKKLTSVLKSYGSGICIKYNVSKEIPKGSGLGVSSTLACGCLKALYDYVDYNFDNKELFNDVLKVERLIKNYSGWQDQIGSFIKGIKLNTTYPQSSGFFVNQLNAKSIIYELNQRSALIYSGIEKNTGNQSKIIVDKYLSNDPLFTINLNIIRNITESMAKAIEDNDINLFIHFLNKQYIATKKFDSGYCNKNIDDIYNVCKDLIDAFFICGAGNGGYIYIILKNNVSKEELSKVLYNNFKNKVSLHHMKYIN